MLPGGSRVQGSADEGGVVGGSAEVVDGGDFVEVRDRLDRYQHALAADQLITHLQFTRWDKPFLSGDIEWMRRCARAGEDRAGEQVSNSG